MSFKINLYTFAKDSNSTKQPTGTGTELNCNILTPADIIAPVVEIAASDPTAYNYAYIASFHRYYFIEGMTYMEGLWQLKLKCDVLATYKTAIGAESLYVLRAASAYDGEIRDNYYPITGDIDYSSQQESPFPGYDYATGCYILNIMGTATSGSTTLYQLTPANFRLLIEELYTAIDGFQLTDVVKSVVQKFGGNPTQLISGAMWFPMDFMDSGTDVAIKVGSWTSTNAVGKLVTQPIKSLPGFNPTIAAHPQVSARGRYLNLAPYSKYQLYIPTLGIIDLDTSQLMGINKIYVTRHVDAFTGQMTCIVETDPDSVGDPNHYLAVLNGQWGVPVSLNGNNNGGNLIGGAIATAGAIAGAIATGGASAIIGAATAGIGTIADAIGGASSSSAVGGSITAMLEPMRLDTTFFHVTDADTTHNGRPLMQVKTISSLSGFIQVQKGDVPIAGTQAEADEIRALLEGGFYYE